jgi:hypothetical protein
VSRQFQQDWQSVVGQPLPFTFGPHFLASIRERGVDTNIVVLTKLVYFAAAVIAGQAMKLVNGNLHPLGETAAPGSSQRYRTEDQAKAWRLRLMEKGAGWRIHYWHIPGEAGGRIEFSNILKKHEPEVIY